MTPVSVDEIIISLVREHKLLYDKSNTNFKNTKAKKQIWSKLSETLKTVYQTPKSASEVEKRWCSLRDMFSRELRRKKFLPPGSEQEPVQEWELFPQMLFLQPHIAHRRPRTPLVHPRYLQRKRNYSRANNSLLSSGAKNAGPSVSVPKNDWLSKATQFINDNKLLANNVDENSVANEDTSMMRPSSALSSCSSMSNIQISRANPDCGDSSSSGFSVSEKLPLLKKMKQNLSEIDGCPKRRRFGDKKIDRHLANISSVMRRAADDISLHLSIADNQRTDGYMLALQEALHHVPAKSKTQCLIEILQVIQKFEEFE